MTTPIPPHTELRMRQCGEAVWNATCAHDPDITPKQAFIEGHYIAFAAGMLANAETSRFYEAKLKQQQWECRGLWIALAAAVIVGVLSR
jgi:hypothetical protein